MYTLFVHPRNIGFTPCLSSCNGLYSRHDGAQKTSMADAYRVLPFSDNDLLNAFALRSTTTESKIVLVVSFDLLCNLNFFLNRVHASKLIFSCRSKPKWRTHTKT